MAVRIPRHEGVTERHLGRRLLNRQPEFAPLVIARLDLLRILAQKAQFTAAAGQGRRRFYPLFGSHPQLKAVVEHEQGEAGRKFHRRLSQ